MRKFDLHCHSTYSDGTSTIVDIEEKCKRDNFSVMLTDHNEIRGSLKLYDRNRIMTLPAIEAGTIEGLEFLIFFADPQDIESFYIRAIEPYRRKRFMVQINVPVVTLLSIANEYECFVSLAHPYGFRKKSLTFHRGNPELVSYILDNISAVETYNGNNAMKDNYKALALYERTESLKLTVGSDGHNIESIGQVTADFDDDVVDLTQQSLYSNLVEKKFVPNCDHSISKVRTMWNIAFAHSRYFINDGIPKENMVENILSV